MGTCLFSKTRLQLSLPFFFHHLSLNTHIHERSIGRGGSRRLSNLSLQVQSQFLFPRSQPGAAPEMYNIFWDISSAEWAMCNVSFSPSTISVFLASNVSVLAHFHSHARLTHQEERNDWISSISEATARAKVRVEEESRTSAIDRVRSKLALVNNSSHFQVQRVEGRDVGESVKKSCCSFWIAWRSRTVMCASVSMRRRSSLCCEWSILS
jgi:hypothetical protein